MILTLYATRVEKEKAKILLEESNINLDQRIKEQTAHLIEEINQRKKSEERLKVINDLMVGRELKMITLEKELERLKPK